MLEKMKEIIAEQLGVEEDEITRILLLRKIQERILLIYLS